MLDDLPDVVGECLPVMSSFWRFLHREAILLGPPYDGRYGHLLIVFLPQKVSDIAVVVISQRYVGVFYHILFDLELSEYAVFNGQGYRSGFGFSLIVN